MKESNGWIITQSVFNVAEVAMQLIFLGLPKKKYIEAVLIALVVSVATLWKTLIYMCIIANSSDPVRMVPGLSCLGYKANPENEIAVAAALAKDNCAVQLFKFQFNFWWIVMPAAVILVCWRIIKDIAIKSKNV